MAHPEFPGPAREPSFRALFENASLPVAVTAIANHRILYANESCLMLFQVARAELEGAFATEFYQDPADQDGIIAGVRAKGHATDRLACLRTRRGDRFLATVSFDLVEWRGQAARLAAFHNVTAVESRLSETEELNRAIVRTCPDGILVVSPEGKIRNCSPAAARMFGYENGGDLVGRPALDLLAPDDRERAAQTRDRRLYGASAGFATFRARRRDGVEFFLESNGAVLHGPGGDPTGLVYVLRDVTLHRRAEETAHRAAALEAVAALAAGAAHDVNSRMSVVLERAALLERKPGPLARQEKGIAAIRSAAERASALARQLLAFARQGRQDVRRVDLNTLVYRAVLEGGADATARTDLRLDPLLWPVEGDAAQLAQVAANLYVNAAEAISGGGSVTVTTRNTSQEDSPGLPRGRYALLRVEDTGCGMDAATAARAFEPFFTTKFQGRGLGLAAAYGIVQSHGGGISLHSEPGRGTCCEVLLPAAGGGGAA